MSAVPLVLRAANAVVGKLEASPRVPTANATATQQLVLAALAAQLRAAAGAILPSQRGPESAEAALGGLVVRTLALVDEALAGQRMLATSTERGTLLPAAGAGSTSSTP